MTDEPPTAEMRVMSNVDTQCRFLTATNQACEEQGLSWDYPNSDLADESAIRAELKVKFPDKYKALLRRAKILVERKSKFDAIRHLLDCTEATKVSPEQFNMDLLGYGSVFWVGFPLSYCQTAYLVKDKEGFNIFRRYFACSKCGTPFNTTTEKAYPACECGSKSAPRILDELEKEYNIEMECDLQSISPTISKHTVKDILNGKKVPLHVAYRQVRDKILYYMDFAGKDEIADVMACWVLATYCFSLFHWFPNILINAPSGSGKSKCGKILMLLGFRGFDLGTSGGSSPAQIFRTLEGNRGVLLLDEFERNNQDEGQKLVCQIINAGAENGAYVTRNVQIDKKWVPMKFSIFCPKIVCNISGINKTSISRFICFKWLKTTSEKGKRKPRRDLEIFKKITNDIYISTFNTIDKIRETYENLDLDLTNRDEDNWAPIFTIAKVIDSETPDLGAERRVKSYLAKYEEVSIETNDVDEIVLKAILNYIQNHMGSEHMQPKEIAELPEVAEQISYYKSPSTFVGRLLKRYGFKQKRIQGARVYELTLEGLKRIVDTYFNTNKVSPSDQPSPSAISVCTDCTVQSETQNKDKVTLGDSSDTTSKSLSFEKIKKTVQTLDSGDGADWNEILKQGHKEDDLITAMSNGEIFEHKKRKLKLDSLPAQHNHDKKVITEVIRKMDTGEGADWDGVLSEGYSEDDVVSALARGDVFEPRKGRLKVLE